jgi:hypothetical protein
MRLQLQSVASPAAVLIGMALCSQALAAEAWANQIDAASAVRGSLGVSAEDLILSSSGGACVFILNAGCAVLFGIFVVIARRRGARHPALIPLRSASNFAR